MTKAYLGDSPNKSPDRGVFKGYLESNPLSTSLSLDVRQWKSISGYQLIEGINSQKYSLLSIVHCPLAIVHCPLSIDIEKSHGRGAFRGFTPKKSYDKGVFRGFPNKSPDIGVFWGYLESKPPEYISVIGR